MTSETASTRVMRVVHKARKGYFLCEYDPRYGNAWHAYYPLKKVDKPKGKPREDDYGIKYWRCDVDGNAE